jgi:CheY-like chemotaxis protein
VPGRYVLVTVTDTGFGMTPDIVARVFEPFFTTKDPRRGTGLGLSVAHGIVRQHGGLLHCYSEPGVGTTFKVYWPLSERAATSVGTKLDGPIRGGTERILVAEDDPSVAAVAMRILEHAGYTVTVVGDGEAACAAAVREHYDLLVLDVVMPGLSATAVLDELRAQRPRAARAGGEWLHRGHERRRAAPRNVAHVAREALRSGSAAPRSSAPPGCRGLKRLAACRPALGLRQQHPALALAFIVAGAVVALATRRNAAIRHIARALPRARVRAEALDLLRRRDLRGLRRRRGRGTVATRRGRRLFVVTRRGEERCGSEGDLGGAVTVHGDGPRL